VRSFASAPARQPARTDRPGAFGPPVGAGVAVGGGRACADALGFALGVGLHVILGNPGTVAVSLAVAPGNVAAAGPDSPANQGYRPAFQLPCGR
jgi:hypothetical protein